MNDIEHELLITWLEDKAGTKLSNFQRDIVEKLNNGDDRIQMLSPPRRAGKTYIARLLLECCLDVSIFLPDVNSKRNYPLEFDDRIHIYNADTYHEFEGRTFDKIIFDEFPHGYSSEVELSSLHANKIIAFVENDWWDYRPGFIAGTSYETYRDLYVDGKPEEDKIGDWDK